MKKVNSRLIFTGIIIAAFCCSFLAFIPITTRSVNSLSTPTKIPMVSTTSGSSNPTGDEWPMFHHSLNHTGVTETTPVVSANINWSDAITTHGNDVWSDTAVTNGMIYVGNFLNNKVYCFNATNGTQIWNYTTGNSVQSTPAVTNGMVYVGSQDNHVYCLNATNGSQIWNYTTGTYVDSSPAVENGMVYVGSNDHHIYCLNASTGAQNWTYTTSGPVFSSPALVNGMVYVGSEDNHVYCLNATNGSQIWNYTTGGYVDSSPAVENGMVYVGDNSGNVTCINANDGSLIWNYTTTGKVTSSPAVANGMVYVGSQNHYVYCLNATDGTLIWNYDTQWIVESSPAVANGMVYVGSDNNSVYCFNALSGAVIWHYFAGIGSKGFASSPAIANGMVYEGGNDGNYYCFPMIFTLTAPLNLQATLGNKNITLSWQAPYNNGVSYTITSYNIYRGTSSGTEVLLTTVDGSNLNYTDTDLTNGETYYYKVSANNSAGEGSQSNEVNAAPFGVPSAPLNLTSTPGNYQISLSWSAPTDNGGRPITGYNIYRGNSSGSETLLTNVSGTTTQYIDTTGTRGLIYYYKVSAINAAGESQKSNEVNSIPTGVPFAPLILHATPGNKNINLIWQAPSNNGGLTITGYNIYRGASSETEVLLTTVGANTLTYTDTGLTAEQTYYYVVSANNSVGEGPQSNEVHFAPFGVPSVPLNLNATVGNNNITLTWQAPSDNGGLTITGYNIYRGTSSGSEVLLATVGASTLTYADTGLTANTTYYYQVSAITSAGIGSKSTEINATTNLAQTSKNKIDGMGIESLLLVSFIGVITVVLGVKKHLKQKLEEYLI